MDMGTVKVTSEEYSVECSSEKLDIYTDYEGSYSVQPSYEAQTLPTDGKVMTDNVTVGAIPADLVDVSSTTAEASDVALGKVFFDSTGAQSTGSLHYDTYAGDYSVQPAYQAQTLQTSGKLMGDNVTVGAIPAGLVDVSPTTAAPTDVLEGRVFFDSTGTQTVGTLSTHVPSLDDPIVFFDYDGTILYTYDEPPEELPPVPTSHPRLVNGEWNYTLSDINAEFDAQGRCWIGAGYSRTASGGVELDITLDDPEMLAPVLAAYKPSAQGHMYIDWGDGTPQDEVPNSGMNYMKHEYASTGSYMIVITGTNLSSATRFNNPSMSSYFLWLQEEETFTSSNDWMTRNTYYVSKVTEVRFAKIFNFSYYATNMFSNFCNLKCVSMPASFSTNNLLANTFMSGCKSLRHFTVPRGVKSTYDLFGSCYGLASVSLPRTVTDATRCFAYANSSRYFLPSTVTNCQNTFSYNRGVRNVVLPSLDARYTSGMGVCTEASYLEHATIGSSSTGVGTGFFENCSNLRDFELPDGATIVGSSAFKNCYALESVTLPDTLTGIYSNAFQSCTSLRKIVIPELVTVIYDYVFYGCSVLRKVTLLGNVTEFKSYAFGYCKLLTDLTIPVSLKTIGSNAFVNCTSLKILSFPSSLTSIGSYAFSNCTAMQEYHFASTTPPTLANTNAFQNMPTNCKIYVPAESLEAYQTASNWSTYASRMVGE